MDVWRALRVWMGCSVVLALLAAPSSRASEPLFREDFAGYRGGRQNAAQVETGLRLAVGGELPGWQGAGQGVVHAVDRTGAGDHAPMIWVDNTITLQAGIAANEGGRHYALEFDLGPTVYATPPQASGPTDGVVVEVLRGDDSVLASQRWRAGPWQGRQEFRRTGFDYEGDGTGPVRIRFRPLSNEGRFGGAIDNLVVVPHSPSVEHFNARIAPLLARECLECHRGPGAEGGLDLATREGARRGGESGVAIVPGDTVSSRLWTRIERNEMPPMHPLAAADRDLIRDWIAAGAAWGVRTIDPFLAPSGRRAGYDWWSLQPLAVGKPPPVAGPDVDWPRNDIDRFVLEGLASAGLRPSPRADPRTLVRRLFVDLVGLPPSPEDIDAFAAAPTSHNWEGLVDRLLDSEDYGERWARHWLDVVRFGESDGYEYNAPRRDAWPYRDWVIRSLNADMPYDRFARMQIAGDVLEPATLDGAAATGFLVAGVHNTIVGASPAMRESARQDELEELAGTVAQTFVGLTVNCARCHDHKFDPIAAEEYYRFTAALAGVTHGTRRVRGAAGDEIEVYTAVSAAPPVTRVLARGDVNSPGTEAGPGGLRAVRGVNGEFGLASASTDAERRLKLAGWIADPASGPFLRSIVNRVWHHHFGRGIVDTPNDLGFNGGRPSHPELLEWLAARFRADGLSLKRLHRLIVTSATYQQASAHVPEAARMDADNRLLWRQNPRRVEAEVLRDSILQVVGALDRRRFGPGYVDVEVVPVLPTHYYLPIEPTGADADRRTVYRWSPRGQRSALLDTFDCPDPSAQSPRRGVTTTPAQALSQWNNAFMVRLASRLAERITADVQAAGVDGIGAQVDRGWRLTLGRLPDAAERQQAITLAGEHGLPLLCRVLFNSNEFVVID